ncbi:hypothetical protein F9B85_06455 [Heliorestis acidaminivorans]|uniref:Oxidoreductase n=1 Tax=Heliorestis acidaminivorans TaxID=553427 RepID=A0A6I0EXA5_9FIRM|nr:hypothetical protein [Heliorestis acidaminivorans]KAB2952910.1 hypothetical protein F9B85_06455 [Heliorestis acidaminivorans]
MYRIDVEYPLTFARLALEKGANHFLVVSSMNANQQSLFWYSRMKADLEEQLKKIPYAKISILQPALLLGKRKEFRLGERMAGIVFQRLLSPNKSSFLNKWAIEAKAVATAMYRIAQKDTSGIEIYGSEQIQAIAEQGLDR